MTLTEQQKRRLQLGNTVNLPPHFPSPGSIYLTECENDRDAIVCIEESDTPDKVIRRYVRLDQIVGVFPAVSRQASDACDYEAVNTCIDHLLIGDRLKEQLNNGGHVRGIAAVYSQAPVLVQLETGMSAMESLRPIQLSSWVEDPCCIKSSQDICP